MSFPAWPWISKFIRILYVIKLWYKYKFCPCNEVHWACRRAEENVVALRRFTRIHIFCRRGRVGLKSQLFGSIMPVRKRPVATLALSSCPPDSSRGHVSSWAKFTEPAEVNAVEESRPAATKPRLTSLAGTQTPPRNAPAFLQKNQRFSRNLESTFFKPFLIFWKNECIL